MPIVLITGGTGVLGRELAPRFADAGYDVRIMSRRPAPDGAPHEWAQADLMTGVGLAEAVAGVDLIVHSATGAQQNPKVDVAGTEALLNAAKASGSPSVLYISIVGIDRIPLGYYKAKVAAEQLIEGSGLPWATLRATQFHTLIDGFLRMLIRLPVAVLPKSLKFQPIDAAEVAERMVQHAVAGDRGRLPDLGGPEVRTFGDLAAAWLKARRKRALVLPLPLTGKTAAAFRNAYNCTPEHAEGNLTWQQWLERTTRSGWL